MVAVAPVRLLNQPRLTQKAQIDITVLLKSGTSSASDECGEGVSDLRPTDCCVCSTDGANLLNSEVPDGLAAFGAYCQSECEPLPGVTLERQQQGAIGRWIAWVDRLRFAPTVPTLCPPDLLSTTPAGWLNAAKDVVLGRSRLFAVCKRQCFRGCNWSQGI